jgi:hypothetical protein
LAISSDLKTDQVLEKALFYNSKDYNARPILAPGQKGQKWNSAEKKWEEVIGDGKKAEGTGAWTEAQKEKQSKSDVEILFKKGG